MGYLGEVLRISRTGRELAEKNGSSSLLYQFRESWLRMLAFDFEGARRICDALTGGMAESFAGQQRTIGRIAAGYMKLDCREYGQALEQFRLAAECEAAQKFFLRWAWRMTAQLESGNAALLSGNIVRARAAAETSLVSALSTSDPHLQALAWDLKTRVAMAEDDWMGAKEYIQHALAIVDKYEILIAAWQTYATAWQLYRHARDHKKAETHRERAEACILKIANSFEPEEPLRATFLAAAPVRRILRPQMSRATR